MADLDILFIHPPIRFQRKWTRFKHSEILQIPMGMPALADLCQRQGFNARVLNIPMELNLDTEWSPRTYLKNKPAKVYAIDIHWFATSYGAIQTARLCKAIHPHARVLLGGSTATVFSKEILATYPTVDAIIRGDTEEPILEYLQTLQGRTTQLRTVPNLSFRETKGKVRENPIRYVATEEDINNLNFINFSLIEHAKEYLRFLERYMPFAIMIARGCPFNCPFCTGGRDSLAHYWKRRKTIFRDPPLVANDIATIREQQLTREIYFGHGIYPATRKYWLQVFKEIRDRGVTIGAHHEVWRLPVSREVLTAYKHTFDPSCTSIGYSLQSTTPKVRHHLAQALNDPTHNHTNAQLDAFLKNCEDLQIALRLWLTFGNPFQGFLDMVGTMWLLAKQVRRRLAWRNCTQLLAQPVTPSPGSPVFRFPERFGVKLKLRTFTDYYNLHRKGINRFFSLDFPIAYETQRLSSRHQRLWNTIASTLALPTHFLNPYPKVE
jgi:hypothetical protein